MNLCIIATALTNLTGCTKLNIKNATSNWPNFSNEFEKINEALTNATNSKSNLELVAPESGEHKLKINRFTDKLNRTFAVVFHKNKIKQNDFNNNLRLSILQKNKKNKYRQLVNIPCYGGNIDKIMFVQNKNCDNAFLVVGFFKNAASNSSNSTNFNDNSKFFSIYELNPNNVHLIRENDNLCRYHSYHHPYCDMQLIDLNDSNEKKLLTLLESKVQPNQSAKKLKFDVYSIEHNNLVKNKSYEFENHMLSTDHKMKIDKKSFEQPAIFLDSRGSNLFQTRIFLLNRNSSNYDDFNFEEFKLNTQHKFKNLLFAGNNTSFDFDNDEQIEIPFNELFPGYELNLDSIIPIETEFKKNKVIFINSKINNPPKITNWLKLSKKNNKIQQQIIPTYTNFAQGYGFTLPKTWHNKISACYANKNKTVEFFKFDENISNNKNKILTITTCQIEDEFPPDFFTIKTRGPFAFLAKIHNSTSAEDKNLLISENELKQSFFLLNNIN